MASTRTQGVTVDTDSNLTINKEYRGVRLFFRLGKLSQDQAEQRLHTEIDRVDCELERKAHARPRFAHCAARYLDESRDKRSFDVIALHVRLLISHLGGLEVKQIHDATLKPFVADRLAAGVSATTINRSLEVVRTILNRAARAYRDDDGRPWLEAVPPLITMLPESPRLPYPITWDEQDRLFPKLPAHLGRMVLFAVNTGLRDSNVCGLEWTWEVPVPEVGRSVFVIPPEAFKAKRAHVVILNDAAWSNRASAARDRSDLGVPLSRPTNWDHEQHRMAACSPRNWPAARPYPRPAAHLWVSSACGRRVGRRSRSPPRPRSSFHGRPLRQCRCRSLDQAGEPGPRSTRYLHDLAHREWVMAKPARWITSRAKVAQQQKTSRAGRAKCLFVWRARQDLNPRPPGS